MSDIRDTLEDYGLGDFYVPERSYPNSGDHGATLERLRILDEIEAVETELRESVFWDDHHNAVAKLSELKSQLQELDA